ncbi:hypothetical protein E9993_16945 [Labilibacter sediminis]|nr:hypothetical protein E9993_16945 [Labilibacter sediminis]
MIKIADKDLKLRDIPSNNDLSGANRFAHSLDKLDSFDNISDISKKVKAQIKINETNEISLRDLRISLFFYFRAIRHSQTEPNKDLINIHLELIRKKLVED